MTTAITKESLAARISELESGARSLKEDYTLAAYKMLLATMEAEPTPERDQVRREHADWSQDIFGNVGPIGPLRHLSKEALEAAAEPDDLSEWADMQFLLWDAQRRAGITDDQITQAMIEKLAVNKQRKWPEPKDGEPRLHIKEQTAPVMDELTMWIKRLVRSLKNANPDSKLPREAMDYLTAKGLISVGDILR